MPYYFFRDKHHEENLEDGMTFHAAGIVEEVHCKDFKPTDSGKDLAVSFIHPFEGVLITEWRWIGEVELFEVDEFNYDFAKKSHTHMRSLYD